MEDVGQNSPSMANLVNVILFDMQMENSAHVAPQSDGVVAHLNIANAKVVRISENQVNDCSLRDCFYSLLI